VHLVMKLTVNEQGRETVASYPSLSVTSDYYEKNRLRKVDQTGSIRFTYFSLSRGLFHVSIAAVVIMNFMARGCVRMKSQSRDRSRMDKCHLSVVVMMMTGREEKWDPSCFSWLARSAILERQRSEKWDGREMRCFSYIMISRCVESGARRAASSRGS